MYLFQRPAVKFKKGLKAFSKVRNPFSNFFSHPHKIQTTCLPKIERRKETPRYFFLSPKDSPRVSFIPIVVTLDWSKLWDERVRDNLHNCKMVFVVQNVMQLQKSGMIKCMGKTLGSCLLTDLMWMQALFLKGKMTCK